MNTLPTNVIPKSRGQVEYYIVCLHNLGAKSKENLLKMYKIWKTGNIFSEWKRGIIIPIPKPGKNKQTTEEYITLLNISAKVLEK